MTSVQEGAEEVELHPEQLEKKQETVDEGNGPAAQEVKRLKAVVAEQTEQIFRLKDEIAQLLQGGKRVEARGASESSEEVEKLKAEVAEKVGLIQQLQEEKVKLVQWEKKARDAEENLRRQMKDQQNEVVEVKARLATMRDSRDEWERRFKRLEELTSGSKAKESQLQEENSSLKGRVINLKAQVDRSELEQEEYARRTKEAEDHVAKAEEIKVAAVATAVAAALVEAKREADSRCTQLEAQHIEAVRAWDAAVKIREAEMQRLQQEIRDTVARMTREREAALEKAGEEHRAAVEELRKQLQEEHGKDLETKLKIREEQVRSEEQAQEEMQTMLMEGSYFNKHDFNSSKNRFVFVRQIEDEQLGKCLTWAAPGEEQVKKVPLWHIDKFTTGFSSDVFKRRSDKNTNLNPRKCLSIHWAQRSLDLECASVGDCLRWYKALTVAKTTTPTPSDAAALLRTVPMSGSGSLTATVSGFQTSFMTQARSFMIPSLAPATNTTTTPSPRTSPPRVTISDAASPK